MNGKIKFYSYKKKYGFVLLENDGIVEDIFFDKKNVLDDSFFFKPGDKVVFNVFENFEGKKYAINIMKSDVDYLKDI